MFGNLRYGPEEQGGPEDLVQQSSSNLMKKTLQSK